MGKKGLFGSGGGFEGNGGVVFGGGVRVGLLSAFRAVWPCVREGRGWGAPHRSTGTPRLQLVIGSGGT